MSKRTNLTLKRQQGSVSLQSIFWIIGIVVGILSILQFALPYILPKLDNQPDEIAETKDASAAAGASDSIEEQPKPLVLDSPSTKIDNYTAYDNGVAIDETLQVMWMRCSLGQDWNGTSCKGSPELYSLEQAYQAVEQLNRISYAGMQEWQLPDIETTYSLVYCSKGYQDSYEITHSSGEKKTVDVDCKGNHIKPTIKNNVFPNTQGGMWHGYWSSSQNDKGQPLTVYFNTGKIKAKDKSHYVRAMRSVSSD